MPTKRIRENTPPGDAAENGAQAYQVFAQYAGNSAPEMNDDLNMLDLKMLKSELKNMTRMVHDYPELTGTIGNMKLSHTMNANAMMSTSRNFDPTQKSDISINPRVFGAGKEGEKARRDIRKVIRSI